MSVDGRTLAFAVPVAIVAASAVWSGGVRRGGSRAGAAVEVRGLVDVLDQLHALERLYRSLHWQASGTSSYGDHLLYERLYKAVPDEIDKLGERIVGLSGQPDEVGAAASEARSAKILLSWHDRIPIGLARAVFGERGLVSAITALMGRFDPGTENLLQGIADQHQEHLYLLGRRAAPSGSRKKGGSRSERTRTNPSCPHANRLFLCGTVAVVPDLYFTGERPEPRPYGTLQVRIVRPILTVDGPEIISQVIPVRVEGDAAVSVDEGAFAVGDWVSIEGEIRITRWSSEAGPEHRLGVYAMRPIRRLSERPAGHYAPRTGVTGSKCGCAKGSKCGCAKGSAVRRKAVPWASVQDGEVTLLGGEPSLVGDDALIAILLDQTTGRRDPLVVARAATEAAGGDLFRLTSVDFAPDVEGLSPTGRSRLVASGELVRRGLHRAQVMKLQPIRSVIDVVRYVEAAAIGPYESLLVVFLNRRSVPIGMRVLTKGSDAFTIVDPRQVFRAAVANSAVSVILVHNHPSGDPTPSSQDREVTRRVAEAGRVVGIPLLDHVVVAAGGQYTSFAEQGLLSVSHGDTGYTGP